MTKKKKRIYNPKVKGSKGEEGLDSTTISMHAPP